MRVSCVYPCLKYVGVVLDRMRAAVEGGSLVWEISKVGMYCGRYLWPSLTDRDVLRPLLKFGSITCTKRWERIDVESMSVFSVNANSGREEKMVWDDVNL